MNEGAPARTAEYMALFRALESARTPGQRLFEDRDAVQFLARGCGPSHAPRRFHHCGR